MENQLDYPMITLLLILLCGLNITGAETDNRNPRIVGFGDSNTSLGDPEGESWVNYLLASLGGDYQLRNAGVSGNTVAQMITRYSGSVGQFYQPDLSYCIILGGLNDDTAGESVDTIYRRIQVACSLSQDTGYITLVCIYPVQQTVMFQVNDSIQANWATFADGIVDCSADAWIGEASDHSDGVYWGDIKHWTILGRTRFAEVYVDPVVRSLP